jgi:uncharacterized phage protein gp47/JayE
MPIVNGNYQQLTAEQIRDALETELQNEFGADIDLTESSVFSTLTETLSTVLSDNQEQSLEDVYRAAYLDTATGIDLDRVVEIIGIQRRSAIHATGVALFSATGRVTQDYVIQNGTQVQTDSDTPTEFETTERVILELIDSFEDGDIAEYSGDTGSGSVISDEDATNGSNVLQLDATDGTHIYNDNILLQQGTRLHADVRPQTGTVPIITFAVQPGDARDYYQIAVDEAADEVRLERVVGDTVDATLDTLTGAGLTVDSFHEIECNWTITDNINVTVYDPDGNELGVLSATDDTYTTGHPGFKSGDATGVKSFDWYTTSEVTANIRCLRGGTLGNVGPNTLTILPSPPSGVDTVTNLYPTGTTDYTDTDQQQFVIGREREEDETLRERARDAVTGGGKATHDALVAALINETQGVTSVTVYENKTETDNTGSGGLPPHSFEVVVFGGDDEDVARTIFETKAITARDYGGVHGTAVTQTVTSNVSGDSREITWSRPAEVNVDMSLDLIVDESYVGDDELRDRITRYIGGTLSNSTEVVGLGVGEDPRVDAIQDIVVGDDTGVIGLDQSVDGDPIETTPSTTTVDGLRVIDVGDNEVAQTDATDASITLNTREQ